MFSSLSKLVRQFFYMFGAASPQPPSEQEEKTANRTLCLRPKFRFGEFVTIVGFRSSSRAPSSNSPIGFNSSFGDDSVIDQELRASLEAQQHPPKVADPPTSLQKFFPSYYDKTTPEKETP